MPSSPLSLVGRVAAALAAAVFALCVAVQHNDPDPWAWVFIYGAALAVCAAAAAGRRVVVGSAVVAAVALVWALTLLPSALRFVRSDHAPVEFTMKAGDSGEEEARECGGLAIVVVACAAVAFAQRRAST